MDAFLSLDVYVMLHGKRDFASVIKVIDLKIGDFPGLPRWTNPIT